MNVQLVPIPDGIYQDASRVAVAQGITVEQYVSETLRDHLDATLTSVGSLIDIEFDHLLACAAPELDRLAELALTDRKRGRTREVPH